MKITTILNLTTTHIKLINRITLISIVFRTISISTTTTNSILIILPEKIHIILLKAKILNSQYNNSNKKISNISNIKI